MTSARPIGHRSVHLVGTVPADNARAAFELFFASEVGDHLPVWLPDGETGDRQDWIQRIIEALRPQPDLRAATSTIRARFSPQSMRPAPSRTRSALSVIISLGRDRPQSTTSGARLEPGGFHQ